MPQRETLRTFQNTWVLSERRRRKKLTIYTNQSWYLSGYGIWFWLCWCNAVFKISKNSASFHLRGWIETSYFAFVSPISIETLLPFYLVMLRLHQSPRISMCYVIMSGVCKFSLKLLFWDPAQARENGEKEGMSPTLPDSWIELNL